MQNLNNVLTSLTLGRSCMQVSFSMLGFVLWNRHYWNRTIHKRRSFCYLCSSSLPQTSLRQTMEFQCFPSSIYVWTVVVIFWRSGKDSKWLIRFCNPCSIVPFYLLHKERPFKEMDTRWNFWFGHFFHRQAGSCSSVNYSQLFMASNS